MITNAEILNELREEEERLEKKQTIISFDDRLGEVRKQIEELEYIEWLSYQ